MSKWEDQAKKVTIPVRVYWFVCAIDWALGVVFGIVIGRVL